jgi:hypothetical protein
MGGKKGDRKDRGGQVERISTDTLQNNEGGRKICSRMKRKDRKKEKEKVVEIPKMGNI